MWKASKVNQSRIKGLTWNHASIVVATLDCIIILKILDYKSRALVDIIIGQILDTTRDELTFEVLTGSSNFLKQQCALINIRRRLKLSSTSPWSQYCG